MLVLVVACGIDLCLAQRLPTPHLLLCVFGLACALGAGFGLAWQAAFGLVARLPRALAYLVWPLSTLALGLRLAFSLGALKRLHGSYSELAIAVLATCGIGALAFGLLLCAMQPIGPERRAFLPDRARRTRALCSLVLVASAGLLALADRTFYVALYSVAHVALRLCALWLAMFGLALAHDLLRLFALSRRALAGLALWLCVVLVTLDQRHPRTLEAFFSRPWPAFVLSCARALVDVDGDGYASLFGGGDCAPFDPRVHPGAREIPDNGIDDNCALGDAHQKRVASAAAVPLPNAASPLDVVLITVDSLRRDRVGLYAEANQRKLTPNLDAWAKNATVFRHAYSPGGWTSLAISSLMRGVYPRKLRWTRFYETSTHRLLRAPLAPQLAPAETPTWLFAFPTDDPHEPLPKWLSRRGMSTVAVIDDGRAEILRPGTSAEIGFEDYIEVNPGPAAKRDDSDTVTLALSVLDRPAGRRLFLWVHFFGVHSPSERHPGVPAYGDSVADRYDHEVRYFDVQLARLLAALDQRSAPTAVFLTADHGEELAAHTRHHGYSVAEDVIRVPFVARVPGWPAGSSDTLVSLVDLMPTILALTETPGPSGLDGQDLHALLASPPRTRVLLSDTWRFDVDERLVADFVAAYDGRSKLLVNELEYGSYLYDEQSPDAAPVLRFDPTADRLSRIAYGYLEETGGMPMPTD